MDTPATPARQPPTTAGEGFARTDRRGRIAHSTAAHSGAARGGVPTAWWLALGALAAGCGDGTTPVHRSDDQPVVLDVQVADPAIVGSRIRVTGIALDAALPNAELRIDAGASHAMLPVLPDGTATELSFVVTDELIRAVGVGSRRVSASVTGAPRSSATVSFLLSLATDMPVSLGVVPNGSAHRNDLAVLHGFGFLAPGEGTVHARFEGTFTVAGETPRPIDARIPVLPAERFARDRGVVPLTTDIGGVQPGIFAGTIGLDSSLQDGTHTTSEQIPTTLEFGPPELFDVEPPSASLEQIVSVRGAGFLGGSNFPDEATIIRLNGQFTPLDEAPVRFGPAELVLEYISGSEVRGVLSTERRGEHLISSLFGYARGSFEGTAVPVVVKGVDEVVGATVPFAFSLSPVRQVVLLRFLPGFYDSLTKFGLAAAAGVMEPLVLNRIEHIYAQWAVDVRLHEPEDFSPNGYAIVEIGGPDPNGAGLFGYDNTPGKDVGNVRLHDKIGGANAETQADMYPGYGGVFVESFLYWSRHPDLPGARPGGAPDSDPMFDELFDPCRLEPASLSEVNGQGPTERVAEVQRAIRALSNMIGETSAHELGHSLGLAVPFGPSTVFHNPVDREGCLMDSGSARPIGERTAEPGFPETHLCHDAPEYLDSILGL